MKVSSYSAARRLVQRTYGGKNYTGPGTFYADEAGSEGSGFYAVPNGAREWLVDKRHSTPCAGIRWCPTTG